MVLPDPSWRVKTRPCPFYQQGRCMFSESCNFLHTVSAQVDGEVKRLQSSNGSIRSPNHSADVIFNSPQSVFSSPQSPRTTGLLLALGDVVADPSPEYGSEEDVGEQAPMQAESDTWSDSLPTLVNDLGFEQYSQSGGGQDDDNHQQGERYITYEDSDVDSDGNWTAISDHDDNTVSQPVQEFMAETTDEIVHTNLTSPRQAVRQSSWTTSPDHDVVDFSHRHSVTSVTTLLSPIQVSTLNLSAFFRANNNHPEDANSFDSGYAENWKPPIPLAASPPRSPSVSSMFDPLGSPSGVNAAPFPFQHQQPLPDSFPTKPPLSPGRTVSPYDLEDKVLPVVSLDSPISQRDATDYLTPMGSSFPFNQGEDHEFDSSDEEEEDFWDSGGATTTYMEPLHNDSVGQNTNELTDSQDFQEQHSNTANSIIDTLDEISVSMTTSAEVAFTSTDNDETAYLAYLKSPHATQPAENDTLDCLYSSYSAISFDRNSTSHTAGQTQTPFRSTEPSISSDPSSSSTPLSFLREPVFTPPPRQRSEKISASSAGSPNSLTSPITSPHPSVGRASPFNDKFSGSGSRSQSPFVQEIEVSRKIPIGFRSSFALGRASTSSLLTNRNNGRSAITSIYIEPNSPGSPAKRSSPRSPKSAQSLPKGLKPLRLSTFINAKFPSRRNTHSNISSSPINSDSNSENKPMSISSTHVTSTHSSLDNHLLSSNRPLPIPLHIPNSIIPTEQPLSPSSHFRSSLASIDEPPLSAPVASWRRSINYSRPSSRLSEPIHEHDNDDTDEDTGRFSLDPYGETIRRPITIPHTAPVLHTSSVLQHPVYAIETPKPTLMFAIASDDIKQVRDVLTRGDADPNECVGPLSALEFTLTNDKLANKLEIVKTLLAYGADPTSAAKLERAATPEDQPTAEACSEEPRSLMEEIDPATRYYLERAESKHTRRMSVLIQRSFFRPLTRVRYDLIGQDRALEQLFRVLSMHSRELAVSPMVVMLCGPSGHGKSLLARKFGSLLEVPTHTVNMTTLRATHNLWESHSMSPYETPTAYTLAEFLTNNEGKRCVVVLDEIEKTEDPKTLWSLLMPWELGRCAFKAGKPHIDVKNVIWLGTSNVGHDIVFQHRDARKNNEEIMSREEYVELMRLLRPKVSERLGASILSRITTVLPFVPFTLEEKRAICSEALFTLGGDMARTLSTETVQTIIDGAIANYIEEEGVRSLHRAISNELVDVT